MAKKTKAHAKRDAGKFGIDPTLRLGERTTVARSESTVVDDHGNEHRVRELVARRMPDGSMHPEFDARLREINLEIANRHGGLPTTTTTQIAANEASKRRRTAIKGPDLTRREATALLILAKQSGGQGLSANEIAKALAEARKESVSEGAIRKIVLKLRKHVEIPIGKQRAVGYRIVEKQKVRAVDIARHFGAE